MPPATHTTPTKSDDLCTEGCAKNQEKLPTSKNPLPKVTGFTYQSSSAMSARSYYLKLAPIDNTGQLTYLLEEEKIEENKQSCRKITLDKEVAIPYLNRLSRHRIWWWRFKIDIRLFLNILDAPSASITVYRRGKESLTIRRGKFGRKGRKLIDDLISDLQKLF